MPSSIQRIPPARVSSLTSQVTSINPRSPTLHYSPPPRYSIVRNPSRGHGLLLEGTEISEGSVRHYTALYSVDPMSGDNERDEGGGDTSKAGGGGANAASNALEEDDDDIEERRRRRRAQNFRGDESFTGGDDKGDVQQQHVDNSSRFLKVPRRTSKSVRFREGNSKERCGDRDRLLSNQEQFVLQFHRIRRDVDGGNDDRDRGGGSGMTGDSHRRLSIVSAPSSVSSGDGADAGDLDDSSTSVESVSGTGVSGASMTSTVADLVSSECSEGAKEDEDEEAGYGSGMTLAADK